MASDREVLREVWDGRLPVCFQLDPDEVPSLQQPDPFYLMVPRLSYFPIVTDKVKKHFMRYISQEKSDNEMWLEYSGQPLKWHYPIGVLYDLYTSGELQLPWNLTVHFDKFPDDIIFRCPNREVVESHFMSSIKEADVLKHRSQVISGMQKKDHNQLWLGLQNDKFDQFWAVNRRLMEASGDQEHFKHVPVRLYSEEGIAGSGPGPILQRLVKPISNSGLRITLAEMLAEIYPDKDISGVRVKTHGVTVPTDTPLQWMSEHLSYPDNFLHLCVC